MILARKKRKSLSAPSWPQSAPQVSRWGAVKNKGQRFQLMRWAAARAACDATFWLLCEAALERRCFETNALRAERREGSNCIDGVVEAMGGVVLWIGLDLGSGAIQATETHMSKTAAAETDERGQKWVEKRDGRENPATSLPKTRARLDNRAWWTHEVPLCSALCQQAGHTPSSVSLHCAALQGQAADLIEWEDGGQHEGYSPVCVCVCVWSERGCGAVCVRLSSWKLSVITTLCVQNKASRHFYLNTGCFVGCVSRW